MAETHVAPSESPLFDSREQVRIPEETIGQMWASGLQAFTVERAVSGNKIRTTA